MANRRTKQILTEFSSSRATRFALFFLVLIALVSIFAFLSPYDPDTINVREKMQGPSWSHPFGTDDLGRDYMTRVLFGGRISLIVGIVAMGISTLIGVTVGAISGYFGGIVDAILMRIVDIISSIPWMILVTVISIYLKPGLQTIILVIGLFSWMQIARLVRAETLSIKEREYVLYAKAIDQSHFFTIFRHVVPAVMPTIVVAATTGIANAIMMESSLSFLGLGVQPPISSWGSMLNRAQAVLERAPYMAIMPGLMIMLTVFSFNKLGDLVRIYVEPKALDR